LVRSGGDITTGRIGPVRCGAAASDGDQQLAMLVRRPRESLEQQLLTRLDAAIGKAWDEEEYIAPRKRVDVRFMGGRACRLSGSVARIRSPRPLSGSVRRP